MVRQLVVQTLFVCLLLVGWLTYRKHDGEKGGDAKKTEGMMPKAARPAMGRRGHGMGGMRGGAPVSGGAVPVVVTPVVRKPIDQFLLSTCTLEARREVQILSRISERIVELKVEEGDGVKDGQALALLDDTERALAAREAKVRMANAKATLERVQGMFKDNIVSQEQLEDAQVAYETAEVQHENAQLMLSYTEVNSPIDGVVVKRHADVGQHVKTNEELFTVANYDPIWGRIHVPERHLNKIRVGMPVKVNVESLPQKEFVGKVQLISPVVDADSGTIKVTFEIPDPIRDHLRPGMFASTHLITETKDNALVLPKKALIIESDTNEVFVVKSYLAAKVSTDYAKLLKSGGKVTIVATSRPGPRVVLESSFHSVPEAAEDDKEIECLLTLPDKHGLTGSMAVELRVPAADAKDGEKVKMVTVRTASFKLRQLAMKRSVKVGFSEGNEIEVLSGVEPGELVVTIGNEDLKQGSIVAITGTEAQGAIQVVKKKPSSEKKSRWGEMTAERMAMIMPFVLRNPKVKAEYDKRLEEEKQKQVKPDESIAKDPAKFGAFLAEMREKGLLRSRSRSGGHPGR